MIQIFKNIKKKLKELLPKTLFARFALIIITPLLLSEIIYIYVFLVRYWYKANKKSINVLVNEIRLINNEFNRQIGTSEAIQQCISNVQHISTIDIKLIDKNEIANQDLLINIYSKTFPIKQLKDALIDLGIKDPMWMQFNKSIYSLYIKKNNNYLVFNIARRRIVPTSLDLILLWTLFPSFLLSIISFIFIKNQIRSIKRLTRAMKDFSLLEKESENFIPNGAREIQEIATAFLKMQEEIKTFINSRTLMLAEISHDLRTPLTRIKLETEFLENQESKEYIKKDLAEMEKMINDYIMFTKGEKANLPIVVDIKSFFDNIINNYKRSGYKNIRIQYKLISNTVLLKADLFKRAINNLINNSINYASTTNILVKTTNNTLTFIIEDNGPGVSPELRNKIAKPFFQVKQNEISNFGLGLAITKNIAHLHKGKIIFTKSKRLGGLCVVITIPLSL